MNGADAASQGPVHQPGGIAFVETAYAKNVGLPVASVVNEAGNAVAADGGEFRPGARGGDLEPRLD